MQQQVHYSVSIHAVPFRTIPAQQPNTASADVHPVTSPATSITNPIPFTEQHARPAGTRLPQNGFKTIKDAARRDFFTIRADAVQDGVLSLLDSLAEYLVWDGMDRRLRAVSSATHTEYPEVVVSVQQIANDIKVRVGHDLCERTIERALKKLCDVGLLSATPRFHQGRRQASSYMLLYTPSMAARLENSRRRGIPKAQAVSDTPPASQYGTQVRDIPESPYSALTRIGDRIPALSVYPDHAEEYMAAKDSRCEASVATCSKSVLPRDQTTIATEKAYVHSGHGSSVPPPQLGENNRLSDDGQDVQTRSPSPVGPKIEVTDGGHDRIFGQPEVCRSAHSANETTKHAVSGEIERLSLHPTSMSPLFNNKKENKKGFKNVFSISDFSKNNRQPEASPDRPDDNGYFLDIVHGEGWVTASHPALQAYLGDLSRYAFFAGHRTLDALREWFQGIENDIAGQRTTLAETLQAAGLSVSPAPIGRDPVEMKETRFGC
jgi:hypothetical protein